MSTDRTQTPSARCVRLLLALMGRGRATTWQLADDVDASRRLVREDLKLLAEIAPVRAEGSRNKRVWVADPGLPVRTLAIFDRIAHQLGREIVRFLDGTALGGGRSRDFAPLEGIPSRYNDHLDRKFRVLSEPARNYANCTEQLDALLDALLREHEVAVDYGGSRGPRRWDRLQPLSLVLYRRALYLLARVDGNPEPLLRLPVERIENVRLGNRFDYPRDWNPDAALKPWFGIVTGPSPERVVLRFSADKATLVRGRDWHPSASVRTLEDGRVELRMRVGGWELVRFALEWGPHCQVVEPQWLRDKVISELRGALALYDAENEGER